MTKKKLNIGLVGYKFMGKAHSNAYRQVGRYFDDLAVAPVLKAICGRNEAGVRAAAHKFGWESYETDWRTLVERKDIDIIDVSAPGNFHAEVSIGAAQSGKHVFCEKPLGNNSQESKLMLDAVTMAGVYHAVFFNYRKVPAVSLLKHIIGDGLLGSILHWRAVYLQDWIASPNFPLVWRLQGDIAGSGANGDLNAHLIDLARYLVGEITEVSGLLETFVRQRPLESNSASASSGKDVGEVTVDDAALALARFANGAVGTFEASRFALGRKNYNRFEINGTAGSAVFNLERLNELELYTQDTPAGTHGFRTVSVTTGHDAYSGHYWPAAHNTGYEHTFINLIYDALTAIGRGENPTPSFYDGHVNNVILDAIQDSARSRKWESVPAISQ